MSQINHASSDELTTVRMIPQGTNSPPAGNLNIDKYVSVKRYRAKDSKTK